MYESISTLHNKLKNKEVTSTQLVESAFTHIESHDESINAFIGTYKDQALEQAAQADKAFDDGVVDSLLTGIPFSLKDVFNVAGMETTGASNVLKGYRSPYTATSAQRLLDAGAIAIGKVNNDSFGFGSSTENSDYMVTKNPWNTDRVPGGSSGGSAAAVAADMGVFSLAEDTGGSIRQPSCFCSTTGLKVTYGRVSRYGTLAYASSLDTVGPIGRNVEDVAIILEAMAGSDPMDATTPTNDVPAYFDLLAARSDLAGLRLGVPKEFLNKEHLDAEIYAALEQAITELESLGAERVDVSLPNTEYGIAAYYVIALSEASSNLSRYDGIRFQSSYKNATSLEEMYVKTKSMGFNDEAKRRIMLGTYALSSGYYDAYFKKAQEIRTLMRQDYEKAFEQVDVMLAPVSPVLPFNIGVMSEDPLAMWLVDVYSLPINVAGVPSLALPAGFSSDNLPIGMQLIGPQFSEELLLQAGYLYQRETEWHKISPTL